MTEIDKQKEENIEKEVEIITENGSSVPEISKERKTFGGKREFKKNKRPTRRGAPRSEFDQKILAIRRVTRVSSGGRRFSFSVAIAIGNKKGKIGVGTGKASDTSLAIEKAVKNAKKNVIDVKTTYDMSIPHLVEAKYSSAQIRIQPAPGRGIVAGSAVRDLVELGGLKDIVGKIISGSKNKLNIAKATIKALDTLNNPKNSKPKIQKDKTSIKDKILKTKN